MPANLPFRLKDQQELVDWTGRQIRTDKRGSIDQKTPPILERLNIDTDHWIYNTQNFESQFKGSVGTVPSLKTLCHRFGYQRKPGLAAATRLAKLTLSESFFQGFLRFSYACKPSFWAKHRDFPGTDHLHHSPLNSFSLPSPESLSKLAS